MHGRLYGLPADVIRPAVHIQPYTAYCGPCSNKRASWSQVSKCKTAGKRMRYIMCDCTYEPAGMDISEACGEDCLNRMMMIECRPDRCPCGRYCTNQQFQRVCLLVTPLKPALIPFPLSLPFCFHFFVPHPSPPAFSPRYYPRPLCPVVHESLT